MVRHSQQGVTMKGSTGLISFLLLASLACSSTDEGGGDGPQLSANVVEVIGGNDQTGPVGQQLPTPIRIQVLDTIEAGGSAAAGAPPSEPVPIPGQLVNFVITSGGGSVFVGSVQTDSLGQAQNLWTLGPTSGTQCLEARAMEGGVPVTFAQVCATATPGALAHAGFLSDTAVVYGDSTYRIPVWATDAFGNTVSAPAPTSLDSLPIVADSLGYRTAFNGAGWYRLTLGGDTLVIAQHLPRGRYRIAYHRNDTTYVETGRISSPNPGGLNTWCAVLPGGQFDGYTGARLRGYGADSVWTTRQVGAGAVDTIGTGTSSNLRFCSAVNHGIANGEPRFRLRAAEYFTGAAYLETDATRRIDTFTWIMPPTAQRADTLWFGLH